MVAAAMVTTYDTIGIGIFAKPCCVFSGTIHAVQTFAAFSQHIVGFLPKFFADQWRHTDGIIMQLSLVTGNSYFSVFPVVRFIGFAIDDISKIDRIAYHAFNGGWIVGIASIIQKAFLHQQL